MIGGSIKYYFKAINVNVAVVQHNLNILSEPGRFKYVQGVEMRVKFNSLFMRIEYVI